MGREELNGFMQDADAALMLKFKEGDKPAFELLLDKYQNRIINFIYRFIGDKQEAADIAQEVFLRVYRFAQDYTPKAKFSTWIYKIAKNLALNELRRKKFHRLFSLEGVFSTEDGEISCQQIDNNQAGARAELEKQDLIRTVKKAIDCLPVNQKLAVILRRYDDLPYSEIAGIIGCSESAVKSLLNRAKETLKEKLKFYAQRK